MAATSLGRSRRNEARVESSHVPGCIYMYTCRMPKDSFTRLDEKARLIAVELLASERTEVVLLIRNQPNSALILLLVEYYLDKYLQATTRRR
jgi:hypothetical protein